ncbi:branched-chain amino acid ABC transporter permease [Azospirillum canadense]|uniref:branched-chain amino acid ABC transporter permease n=1 Tax=Azospirillum canadense TaxID=403962 RepID=UPI0022275E16|nr:branched-chain amino acid ABC transporter permease [Azospirillum canadense]MCW2238928.1 branched-chain amino acid transport system permease protein [Azospirillum canadense]
MTGMNDVMDRSRGRIKSAAPPRRAVRRFTSDHALLGGVWLVLAAYPFVAPNDFLVSLGVLFFINLILIASLNTLMGFCGQISLSHGAFYGLGAYTSGILSVKLGVDPWIGVPAGMLVAALSALVIGLPALRLRGHYLAMATLGFNAILTVLFNELVGLTGGPNGLLGVAPFSIGGLDIATDDRVFWLVWACGGLVMLSILNLVKSRVGRALSALATSEIGADALGVNCFRYKLVVFVLTAAMAGLAGGLYVHYNQYASPETFGYFTSVMLVVMVALGGWGRYWGPLFGALLYTAVPEALRSLGDFELFLFGLCMILVLLFFPGGIAAAVSTLGNRLFGKKKAGGRA